MLDGVGLGTALLRTSRHVLLEIGYSLVLEA